MQIVIDIPENIYEYYKNKYPKNCARLTFVENALLEGTPLPKGHGRLIDVERLYDDFESMDYDFEDAIEYAPTIIEADKEVKE